MFPALIFIWFFTHLILFYFIWSWRFFLSNHSSQLKFQVCLLFYIRTTRRLKNRYQYKIKHIYYFNDFIFNSSFSFAKLDWNKMKMEKIDHFTFKFEILVEYSIILFIIIIIIVVFYCIFFLHSHSGEKTGRFAALLLYYTIPHQTIEESKIVLQSMFRASTVWCVAPR